MAVLVMALGSFFGGLVYATPLLLISRIFEGAGYATILLSATAIIAHMSTAVDCQTAVSIGGQRAAKWNNARCCDSAANFRSVRLADSMDGNSSHVLGCPLNISFLGFAEPIAAITAGSKFLEQCAFNRDQTRPLAAGRFFYDLDVSVDGGCGLASHVSDGGTCHQLEYCRRAHSHSYRHQYPRKHFGQLAHS